MKYSYEYKYSVNDIKIFVNSVNRLEATPQLSNINTFDFFAKMVNFSATFYICRKLVPQPSGTRIK